jgi:2'-5' RNA ligase
MRLFVALPLPEPVRDGLRALGNGLPGARWVPPENLHLTLRFIGEVDGRDARDIDDALAAIRMPAFALQLAGVGVFGEGRKLRSVWVDIEANPEVTRLRDKVEQAVIRAGRAPEARKFKPHVSIARFKNGTPPPDKLQKYLAEHALYKSEPFPIDSFTLFSSFLSSSGAIYTPEVEYALTQPFGRMSAE